MSAGGSPGAGGARAPIPLVVIGGYLGAGKTTLLNHLLRHARGERLGILVNDFGDVSIDAALIESRDDGVLALAGGCVCCSIGSDLVGALRTLAAREPRIDRVLIETSGVALPGAVARSAQLAPGVALAGVVVLVDAETVRARAADRYVGDTVLQQLREADLLVLNKLDLLAAGAAGAGGTRGALRGSGTQRAGAAADDAASETAALRAWLAEQAPGVPVVQAHEAQVPPELVLDVRAVPETGARAQPGTTATLAAPPTAFAARPTEPFPARPTEPFPARPIAPATLAPAQATFDTAVLALGAAADAQAIARALVDPAHGVVRGKGLVLDRDGAVRSVQSVGARARVGDRLEPPADAPVGRLVVIGHKGLLDAPRLALAIGAACV